MVRFQVYVKWRFITSPDVEETQGGALAEGSPEDVGEDVYHPDKMIAVGQPFDRAEDAAAYATARGWKQEDCEIRPYEILD